LRKVTRTNCSSDAEQLAQFLKYEGEGPIEDHFEDFLSLTSHRHCCLNLLLIQLSP
ncbi:hypothetical protein ACLOJK_039399, partial [Asimina triloba]